MRMRERLSSFIASTLLVFSFSYNYSFASVVSVDDAVDCHFAYKLAADLKVVEPELSNRMINFWVEYFASLKVPPTKGVLREKLLELTSDRKSFDEYFANVLQKCDVSRVEIIKAQGVQ